MTLVTKTIKGLEYYYFQDSIKLGGKNKIITTCVCRTDVTGQKLMEEKNGTLLLHFVKILKFNSIIGKKQYKFESVVSEKLETLNDTLDYVRFIFTNSKKLLSAQELEDFEKVFFTKYVYGTTAIEGNTLTEEEAYRLLATDLTPKNKTVNETFEVSNYNHVREYITKCSGNVTEKMILQIHKLLMTGVRGYNGKLINAGEYRTGKAILLGIDYTPPPPEMVSQQLRLLVAEYTSKLDDGIHPLEAASNFHQKFEEIHPFQDGNGRVGRELLNYMLTEEDFPPIYITPKHRSDYLNTLQEGNKGEYLPLFEFLLIRMLATIEYLFTKTSLYSVLVNDDTKTLVEELGGEGIYDGFLTMAQKARNNSELP